MVTTDNPDYVKRMRMFRNHCIDADFRQREEKGAWFYQMVDLGYNYRISDFQCALGMSQLKKLPEWIQRRQEIAAVYDRFFVEQKRVRSLQVNPNVKHAYHLYVVRVDDRDGVFKALRSNGIGVNVHYVPVHLHPYYKQKFRYGEGLCPVAEKVYGEIISLPMYQGLTEELQDICLQQLKALRRTLDGENEQYAK